MTALGDAVELFEESVKEWQTGEDEPLCIDRSTRHRVWITMGGPAAYVDIFTADGGVISGAMVSTYSGDRATYILSDEECEEVAELLHLGE